MAQGMMAKMWIQDKIDGCKLSEEEARDPTKMKASTFARWLGLGGTAICFFAGAYVMATYDSGGATDVLSSNSTNVTAAEPTAAPTAVAEAEAADDGVCIMSGVFAFLVSVPILLLEVSYFILKGGGEMTEEEMAKAQQDREAGEGGSASESGKGVGRGAGPDDDKEDDDEAEEEGAEGEEEGDGKPSCCAKCLGKLIRCIVCRYLYENWYIRAGLYLLVSVFMFPCGTTMVCGILLLICGLLYAFAKWRGELAPMAPEEKSEEETPAEEEEVEDAPKKEKKRKRKPAKHGAVQ